MPQRFDTSAVMKPVLFKLTCTGQREDNNERKHERAIMYLKHPENHIQGQILSELLIKGTMERLLALYIDKSLIYGQYVSRMLHD